MIKLDKKTKEQFLELWKQKDISLEGNILKLIDSEGDTDFAEYIEKSIAKDKESRKKRLDITKQVQIQNKELLSFKEENEKVQKELTESLKITQDSMEEAMRLKKEAEDAKTEAEKSKEEAEKARLEAINAKIEAENAKRVVEADLDILQKRTQNELTGTIVKVALWVILGVGIITTGVYLIALFTGKDTAVIASTWSNIIGILLTNAFSIVGTIMGIKYASGDKKD